MFPDILFDIASLAFNTVDMLSHLTRGDIVGGQPAAAGVLGDVAGLVLPGVTGVGMAARTAKAAEQAAEATATIYRRIDDAGEVADYIGQTTRFEARQAEHAAHFPGSEFRYESLDTVSRSAADRYEEYWIRRYGGPGELANKRHQMSQQRYEAAGGDPYP